MSLQWRRSNESLKSRVVFDLQIRAQEGDQPWRRFLAVWKGVRHEGQAKARAEQGVPLGWLRTGARRASPLPAVAPISAAKKAGWDQTLERLQAK